MIVQDLLNIVATIALGLAGLTVTILTYRRDRSRILATSRIEWHRTGVAPDTPLMRIRIQNTGQRPVVVTQLVARAGNQDWCLPLDVRSFSLQNEEDLKQAIQSLLREPAVPIELAEGKYFDKVYSPEECDDLVFTAASSKWWVGPPNAGIALRQPHSHLHREDFAFACER